MFRQFDWPTMVSEHSLRVCRNGKSCFMFSKQNFVANGYLQVTFFRIRKHWVHIFCIWHEYGRTFPFSSIVFWLVWTLPEKPCSLNHCSTTKNEILYNTLTLSQQVLQFFNSIRSICSTSYKLSCVSSSFAVTTAVLRWMTSLLRLEMQYFMSV